MFNSYKILDSSQNKSATTVAFAMCQGEHAEEGKRLSPTKKSPNYFTACIDLCGSPNNTGGIKGYNMVKQDAACMDFF